MWHNPILLNVVCKQKKLIRCQEIDRDDDQVMVLNHVIISRATCCMSYLVVVDWGGSVVPSENSVLGAQTNEGDEVLSLCHVEGLPVGSRGHPNHRPASVAEWHSIYGFLHRSALFGSILWHSYYKSCHCYTYSSYALSKTVALIFVSCCTHRVQLHYYYIRATYWFFLSINWYVHVSAHLRNLSVINYYIS